MKTVTITFRDGTKKVFEEKGRPGGSYSIVVKYEGQFVIVVDEWYNTVAFPVDLIQSVESTDPRLRW